jgi:hypothetical protein
MLGVSVWNFMQLGGRADFLCPFICTYVSGLMQFRVGTDKGTASNSVQILEMETLAMIRQVF